MRPARVVLELRQLTVAIGGRNILHAINLSCAGPSCVALLGPNGSGKSTVFRAIGGLCPTKSGSISISGTTLESLRPWERFGLGIVRVEQENRLPTSLTVDECLAFAQGVRRYSFMPRGLSFRGVRELRGRIASLHKTLSASELTALLTRKAGQISFGQARLVALHTAAISGCRLVLLDEPFTGLDVDNMDRAISIVQQLKKHALVLLSDHNLAVIKKVADSIVLINDGSVLKAGGADDVAQSDEFRGLFGDE